MKGIVFLDRDGTLIAEEGYLRDPAKVRILPGAAEALRTLAAEGVLLAVTSNQSGVARGIFTFDQMMAVHRTFEAALRKEGVLLDAVEYCPHHPEGVLQEYAIACPCRKPGTGMAEAILRRLGVPESCPRWVVGDKMTDILFGIRLGARTVLVGTGYGAGEREEGERMGIVPDAFLPGMREAAAWILAGEDAP
ncbi:MAG: HAD family hydrolase [Thermodesulfobacteriota bacterium]